MKDWAAIERSLARIDDLAAILESIDEKDWAGLPPCPIGPRALIAYGASIRVSVQTINALLRKQ